MTEIQSKKRCYIAGPMASLPQFNFPAFHKAEDLGRALGYDVVSPAAHDNELGFDETKGSLEGFDLKAAMRWDIEQITTCDYIALLPGWEKSKGAKVELAVAVWFGVKVLDATTFEPFTKGPRVERNILDEAKKLVHGDRNASYGAPVDDFSRTAGMLNGLMTEEIKRRIVAGEPMFNALDIPRFQICVKLSRTIKSPGKSDHWTDCAGYAECADWVVNG